MAGLLVGLIARGASPIQTCLWAVYVHGLAGEHLSRSVGPLGFLAHELSPLFPRLLHARP